MGETNQPEQKPEVLKQEPLPGLRGSSRTSIYRQHVGIEKSIFIPAEEETKEFIAVTEEDIKDSTPKSSGNTGGWMNRLEEKEDRIEEELRKGLQKK